MATQKTLLERFTRQTIDASELRGLDREVIEHAVAMGWIEFRGRRVTLTERAPQPHSSNR